MNKTQRNAYRVLLVATAAVFLGRSWQHLFLDAPFRTLFWDQNIMEPLVTQWLQVSWNAYVSDLGYDLIIQRLIIGVGVFYGIIGILILLVPQRSRKWLMPLLILGAFSLIFLAFLYSKERFYQAAQFWEYALQFGAPLILFWYLLKQKWTPTIVFMMKVAVAVTFTAHGLYAAGIYPKPALFSEMTINILGLGETQSTLFLNGIAVADFVASVLLFTRPPLTTYALIYCIVWGFLTAIARVWGNFNLEWWNETLFQWLHECIFRFPHFLIPAIILLLQNQDLTRSQEVVPVK